MNTPETADQPTPAVASSALLDDGQRCLVCNGIGGHEEGCRGTSAYDELWEKHQYTLVLLKSLHAWFMEKAPEHYNGCGLWIDVDETLRESSNKQIAIS